MDILSSVFGFVLAVGILVAFHEYGHFWVARRLGVKVLRYSIGFGRPLLRWHGKRDNTEYVLAAIPLGGYVKMLDEREGEVAEADRPRAFNRQTLPVRTAIVAAGPLANFLFAAVAYWAIFVIGSTELRPVVGEVRPDSPAAAAGLERGDELLRVGGSEVRTWQQALMALLGGGLERGELPLQVAREDGRVAVLTLDLRQTPALGEDADYLRVLGLEPWLPRLPPELGRILPDGAAADSDLAPGDRVLAVAGEPVDDWNELVAAVRARPGERVDLLIVRNGVQYTRPVTLGVQQLNGESIGALGVGPHVPPDLYADMQREVRYGPVAATTQALRATWDASALTLRVLGRMVIGEASLKNLSGPINIAQYAGDTVSMGLVPFLKFLAIVSISLGILNLLPVPILDGGHLLYFAIEAVRGKPLSEHAQVVGQQVGILLLVMLMGLAIFNDLARLFG